MRTFLLALTWLSLSIPAIARSSGATIVKGPTFEGAIFTPEMLPKPSPRAPHPLIAAGIWPAKAHYWTPAVGQVRQFEQAFAAAVRQAQRKLPPPGSHDHDYYAPKNFSRDWQKPEPDDLQTNFLYGFDSSDLTPQLKRQYIGVTVSGKKMLVTNLACNYALESPEDISFLGLSHWKWEWLYIDDAGHQIFYDLGTGKMWEIDT